MGMAQGAVVMGVTIAALILFLITAYGAAWIASHYGPLATA